MKSKQMKFAKIGKKFGSDTNNIMKQMFLRGFSPTNPFPLSLSHSLNDCPLACLENDTLEGKVQEVSAAQQQQREEAFVPCQEDKDATEK